MKRLLPILIAVTSFGISLAQKPIDRHMEYGFGIGGMNYTGDLSPNYNLKFYRPGAQVLYRHNFSDEVSVLRANILFGQITAKEKQINQSLPRARKLEFQQNILELAALYEYDFFNFRDLKNIYYMSPYLFGGFAATVIWGGRAMFSIPFGAGVKLKISDHWNLGLEFGARKTFSDRLDTFTNEDLLSSSSSNDWYYFTGLNFTRTVYRQICADNTEEPLRRK